MYREYMSFVPFEIMLRIHMTLVSSAPGVFYACLARSLSSLPMGVVGSLLPTHAVPSRGIAWYKTA